MRLSRLILCLALGGAVSGAERIAILEKPVHLGVAGKPEWEIFAGKSPAGESLQLEFAGRRNEAEQALVIRQSDVKQEWSVELNGQRLGGLHLMESDLVQVLAVPPGAVREGVNELRISTRRPEDIVLHEITLAPKSRNDVLAEARLVIAVRENGKALPARITVVDAQGFLAALATPPDGGLAVRPGVIYTGNGRAEAGLLPGEYTVYATRGPEYSMASAQARITPGERRELKLDLKREVPTHGWVACDTHIHTLTMSGHGDATLEERLLTLAGEGLELPVCTEHNRNANYPEALRAKVARYLTPVPGNEVTTRKGHFNIFPVETDAPPPNAKLEHWPDLMEAMRATPKVQVVVLNHPHDVHNGFTPMARTNLHPATGRNLRGFDFEFNAMELINSGAMRTDWMEPVRTWFALLNRGYQITGVGASDSHDVSRFIVGQARTYIRAEDSNPGRIDLEQVCANLLAGRAVVSLGLFPELRVAGKGPGELVQAARGLNAEGRVYGASWVSATRAVLFANGVPLQEGVIHPAEGKIEKGRFEWALPERTHDYFLVLVASGPGETEPFWGLARPYQPSSPKWKPAVIGITNPIRVDADGDGKFTSARGYAEQFVKQHEDVRELVEALAAYDWPVSAHAAELLDESDTDLTSAELEQAIDAAAPVVRHGFDLYLEGLAR